MAVFPEFASGAAADSTSSGLVRADTESLSERLAGDMAERWQQGERPRAEEYLERYPELWQNPEAAADLIYEEICLCQEYDAGSVADVLARFPQWRASLEVLLQFHQLLGAVPAPPAFPEAGATLGEFTLLSELGRGARGRVFLASQAALAARPVVLKLTPCEGEEHLSLARLQHTHIVPIYSAQDDLDRNLRVLCMPCFGGITLARLLEALTDRPLSERRGQHWLELLDLLQIPGTSPPTGGTSRAYLARVSHVQAVCWLGACLADALQYAHERDLVHLDVKPSNILLAADGQPMLLDFHLTRAPIPAQGLAPEWLGGTAAYMSPEQLQALAAVRSGQPVPAAVDGRSDVYSLGLVLYEALCGQLPALSTAPLPRLESRNPQVSTGLADLVHKCLAPKPADRYARAADLAADLRRHLSALPLQGVRNRSLRERWHKWRQRQPFALRLWGVALAVFLAAAAVITVALEKVRQPALLLNASHKALDSHQYDVAGEKAQQGLALVHGLPLHRKVERALEHVKYLAHVGQQRQAAEDLLERGQRAAEDDEFTRASLLFQKGWQLLKPYPEAADLAEKLHHRVNRAARQASAEQLHTFVDNLRFNCGMDMLPVEKLPEWEERCRPHWQARETLLTETDPPLPAALSQQIRADLLDLALLWAELRTHRATTDKQAAAREALAILAEAEMRFGPSSILYRERQRQAETLGWTELAQEAERQAAQLAPRSAWEWYALGRFFLQTDELNRAAAALRQAVQRQPHNLWANFYAGRCAYRRKNYGEAVVAFTACIALASREDQQARCFFNRALAYAQERRSAQAIEDYTAALTREPELAAAALNRGILHFQAKHYDEACHDFHHALAQGAAPALVHYNLALVHQAQGNRTAALASARRAVQADPQQAAARTLLDNLRRQP